MKAMEQEEKREALVQNLKDAGCDQETIEKYCQCCDCGDQRGKERLLEQHRRDLLDDMHRAQKRIDCLDYLWYQERKKQAQKTACEK